MNVEEILERFIIDEVMLGDRNTKLDPGRSLLSSGILDSLALLRLITFVEEKFGLTIGDIDVVPDNFETLNHIVAYLKRKQQTG